MQRGILGESNPNQSCQEHADLRQYLDYQINTDQIEGKNTLIVS